MNRKEAVDSIKRKINGAYSDRQDYPPFVIMSYDDRARYHAYILKLLDEWVGGMRE